MLLINQRQNTPHCWIFLDRLTQHVASRMESNGVLGCVNVSKETRDEIAEDFFCEEREPINIKGKGLMISYIVKGPKHTLGEVPRIQEDGEIVEC